MNAGWPPQGWIDAHCHLADPALESSRDRLIRLSLQQGISTFVQGGISPEDWHRQQEIGERFPGAIVCTFGLHPWWVLESTDSQCEQALLELGRRIRQVPALGEIGLDHSKGPRNTWARQELVFKQQLEIARQAGKPVVLHVVKTHGKSLELLRAAGVRGMVHGFSGSFELARTYIQMGLCLSIGGGVLKPGFEALKKALPKIPADRLVIESESPGEPHDPCRLLEVARAVARIKQVEPEAILRQSRANLIQMLGA